MVAVILRDIFTVSHHLSDFCELNGGCFVPPVMYTEKAVNLCSANKMIINVGFMWVYATLLTDGASKSSSSLQILNMGEVFNLKRRSI